jgi:hypothetical protein
MRVRIVAWARDGTIEEILEPGNPLTAGGRLRAPVQDYLTGYLRDGLRVEILPLDEDGRPIK